MGRTRQAAARWEPEHMQAVAVILEAPERLSLRPLSLTAMAADEVGARHAADLKKYARGLEEAGLAPLGEAAIERVLPPTRLADLYELLIARALLRDYLGGLLGLEDNRNQPAVGQTRHALSASFVHSLVYCFQGQGEIANHVEPGAIAAEAKQQLLTYPTVEWRDAVVVSAAGKADAFHVTDSKGGSADGPAGCRFRDRCPKAFARCAAEEPPVTEVASGHFVACWKG